MHRYCKHARAWPVGTHSPNVAYRCRERPVPAMWPLERAPRLQPMELLGAGALEDPMAAAETRVFACRPERSSGSWAALARPRTRIREGWRPQEQMPWAIACACLPRERDHKQRTRSKTATETARYLETSTEKVRPPSRAVQEKQGEREREHTALGKQVCADRLQRAQWLPNCNTMAQSTNCWHMRYSHRPV